MLIDLQLQLSAAPLREVAAWFLAGQDPARWLEELARCGLADTETRLFIVAKSVTERTVAGVLVIPPEHREPSVQPRGLPCGMVAARLFLPVDAALSPPLTETEVKDLCHFPVAFFHPTFGLSAFENQSGLRICDLLDGPLARTDNWNLARAAQTQPAPFRGIILAQPPTIEKVFGEESEDIGSEADDPLPPAPNEPKEDPLSKAARRARKLFARNVSDLLRQLPHRGRRNCLNDVEDWANRQLHGVSSQLDKLRNKELHRLLHLLDEDPEAGLRHAIPLNDFASRGRAPSGARLGERNIHFDPSRLGGGPADYWNISRDLQLQLTRRYRAMADREMQLGRHRRAAYIYAELLGDLASAANALKQGRHFREAALLYEERLHNALAAAQCLAEGGLLQEAVERYEKLGRWLEAADLYERLEDPPRAEAALRRVVKQRLAAGDVVGAAQLLETRLKAVDEALTLLQEAWPRSRQAIQCLAAQFAVLGRFGRIEAALDRLVKLRLENLSGSYLEPLTGALADVAANFPDQRVRHSGADLARVMIARQIAEHSLSDSRAAELMRLLYRLAPNDRLLVRDGNRHLATRRARAMEVRRAIPVTFQPHAFEPKVLKTFELPRQMEWLHVRGDGPWFFAAGVTSKHLTLLRGTWDGEFQSLTWNCSATSVKQGLICEPVNRPGNRQVIVSVAGQDGLKEQLFPPDLFISRSCTAGTPSWLSRELYPFTIADTNLWSMHMAAGQAILSCYGLGGGLLRTLDITMDLLTDAVRTERSRLCLGHIGHGAIVAVGNRMIVPRGDGSMDRVELSGDAKMLVSTLPHTRAGVVVLLDRGAVMHWLGQENLITLENDTEWISAAWTPSGKLVLVSASEICLADVDTRGVHGIKRFPWHGRTPIAVTAAGEPAEFAVFSAEGRVAVFNAPDK